MTKSETPADSVDTIRRVIGNIDTLLLDFDGPVCSIFSEISAPYIASRLLEVLSPDEATRLPASANNTKDPFSVLHYAATIGPEVALRVEVELRKWEIEAAKSASPTVNSHELVRNWRSAGGQVAIVSNNSIDSISTYLDKHDLSAMINFIAARTGHDPVLLKPSPYLLVTAIDHMKVLPARCVMLGDSASDMIAARRANVTAIGLANKAGKYALLRDAGAAAVMTKIIPSLRPHPRSDSNLSRWLEGGQ